MFLCNFFLSFIHAYNVSWSHPPSNSPSRTSLSHIQSLDFCFITRWAQLVLPLCMGMWGPSRWLHKPAHMGSDNWTQCFTNSPTGAWTAYIRLIPHPFIILYGKNLPTSSLLAFGESSTLWVSMVWILINFERLIYLFIFETESYSTAHVGLNSGPPESVPSCWK